MKKTYIKPAQCVVLPRLKTPLLSASVINPGDKNVPAGSRGWDFDEDFEEDLDESDE